VVDEDADTDASKCVERRAVECCLLRRRLERAVHFRRGDRERVVEGAQRISSSDVEVEMVADPLVADCDLHSVARAAPEEHDFHSIRGSFAELDPVGGSYGAHGLLLSKAVVVTTNGKRRRGQLHGRGVKQRSDPNSSCTMSARSLSAHEPIEGETMTERKIGTQEEWDAAREELLAREKEHTRLGDELAQQRRELPWVPVEKKYRFDTDDGEKALVELFDGRSQLLVYHFMFGPSYEAGCPTCSSMADGINGVLPHLHARDVTFLFVSQAPLEKLQAYERRMGWSVPWVSSAPTDFNVDLGFSSSEEQTREAIAPMLEAGMPPIVAHNAGSTGTDVVGYLTELFGFSTFVRDDGTVYQTYSTTGRGVEFLMGFYPILDRAPKGRAEGDEWQMWIRRHDEYGSERG
jgi:predicted dithiol-disulfide oxidoreductase (DUF899 family)